MDYLTALDISASGMSIERLRLDIAAMNLANVNSVRDAQGRLYTPMKVLAHSGPTFEKLLGNAALTGVERTEVVASEMPPRRIHDPGNPLADQEGFVTMPNINPVDEMVNLITAVRVYEANVRALNAGRAMALRALEIGRNG